jgi:hypothetical protein
LTDLPNATLRHARGFQREPSNDKMQIVDLIECLIQTVDGPLQEKDLTGITGNRWWPRDIP